MDVDIIMAWPIKKLFEYMAFYRTESNDFKESQKKPISFEEICKRMEKEGLL